MEQMSKKWKILPGFKGDNKKHDIPEWLLDILANRGIKTDKEIKGYLEPNYESLLPFDSFLNMKDAVDRIKVAKEKNEKIVVYGDYDVDGICSTALVFEILSKIGIQNIETYIPHREDEGYGLNVEAIDELAKEGAKLIVAVDCGITAKEQIAHAKGKDIDVIVCDHHEIDKDKLPKDAILVHPAMVKKGINHEPLCACGMAFFLARAIQDEFKVEYPLGQEKWLLDLVALATICDVVPLIGQNRILAKYGLQVIEKTKRVGITELMKASGVRPDEVSSYAVGFLLGPRINAAGRLEHAKKALELLLTRDAKRATEIAGDLSKLNIERQKMCDKILTEAKGEIESSDKKEHEIYLLSNKNWPRGVVGIIASKLSDSYSRPVIVFEDDGETLHGSARSIESFDITNALSECEEHIVKFGGHARAAGLTVANDKFVLFSDMLLKVAKGKIKKEDLRPEIYIDTKIDEKDISDEMIETISAMEPFGFGNHNPTFLIEGTSIESAKKVGAGGEHLKFVLAGSGIAAIFFGTKMEISPKSKYDIVLSLRYNFWNQRKSIEARVIDLKEAGESNA